MIPKNQKADGSDVSNITTTPKRSKRTVSASPNPSGGGTSRSSKAKLRSSRADDEDMNYFSELSNQEELGEANQDGSMSTMLIKSIDMIATGQEENRVGFNNIGERLRGIEESSKSIGECVSATGRMEALLATMVEFWGKMCTGRLKGQLEGSNDGELVVEQPDNELSTEPQ